MRDRLCSLLKMGMFLAALLQFAPAADAQPAALPTYVGSLPQIASGAGWVTRIYLINSSSASIVVRVRFFDDQGSALALPLEYSFGLFETTSDTTFQLAANGTFAIETGPLETTMRIGWAEITASDSRFINGYAVFRYDRQGQPSSEGTVSLDRSTATSLVIPYDNLNDYQTGIALVNLSEAIQGVTFTVFAEDGRVRTVFQGGHLGRNHNSFFTTELLPVTRGTRGKIVIQSTGPLVALGLRFSPSGLFTSTSIFH